MKLIFMTMLLIGSSAFAVGSSFNTMVTGIEAGHSWARSGWPSGQIVMIKQVMYDRTHSVPYMRMKTVNSAHLITYVPSTADMSASDWVQIN